jgi:hypothetical protein
MAIYVEVLKGEHQGMLCFVRQSEDNDEFYETFDREKIKKEDCKVLDYEKNRVVDTHPGCRYR